MSNARITSNSGGVSGQIDSQYRTCAIDGWRDATHMTNYEGRKVPSCDICPAGVDVEPPRLSIAARVLMFTRVHVGMTSAEISDALGMSGAARKAVLNALKRAVGHGYLVQTGPRACRHYYRGPREWAHTTGGGDAY